MQLPANLGVYLSAFIFVAAAYAIALHVGFIVWAVRDIRKRTRDVLAQILTGLLVALFSVPGLIVYVLLRPHTTLAEEYDRSLTEEALLQELDDTRTCPNCQRRVDPDFVICPSCHHQLKLRCVGCGRLLEPEWTVCPYCGLYKEQPSGPEQEEEPDEFLDEEPAELPIEELPAEELPAEAGVPQPEPIAQEPDDWPAEPDQEITE